MKRVTGDKAMATILVVEDNSAVRFAYQILLKNAGHEVVEAVSGDDAIAKLSDGRRFDLVITDLWMPGTDGFTVIGHVKRHHPGTPVVAVTGGGISPQTGDTAGRAEAAGADAVIVKPVLAEGMVDQIEDVMRKAAQRRTGAPS
jgi:DNA-binding NtrC family response regulator